MNTLPELYNAAVAKLVELDERRDEINRLRHQAAAAPHERDKALATVDLTDDAALAKIAAIPARAEAMKRRADLMTDELCHGDAGLRPLAEQLHGAVVSALEARVEPLVSRATQAVAPFCNGLEPRDVARDLPAVRVVLGEARTVLHPTGHATFETALRTLVAKVGEHGLLDADPQGEPDPEPEPARPTGKAARRK